MSTRSLTIEHGGETYYGFLARIDRTTLGLEDHGIMTAYLHCSWSGSGIGVGGYCLDQSSGSPDYKRVGTAYGLDHILRILETVGASKWEDLPGKSVIVLFDRPNSLGSIAKGIAGVHNDEVFIPAAHAEQWKNAAVTA